MQSDKNRPDPRSALAGRPAQGPSASADAGWTGLDHILAVRLDNMGDVLMASPALGALRAMAGRLSLLCSSSGAALGPHLPAVDTVLSYEASWVKRSASSARQDRAAVRRIAALRPDAAVIFTTYSQSALPAALMLRLAGVPKVLAYSRENPYRLLSNWVPETEPHLVQRHEVLRHLHLVATVGAVTEDTRLTFALRQKDIDGLRRKLLACGMKDSGGWIAVHAGASAQSRRYPARLFVRVLDGLCREGRRVLLLGGAEEPDLAAALAAYGRPAREVVNLGGRLTVGEMGAAIAGADVLVCNNSGPAHVAAALQVPVLVLYALTNPQHTPWQTVQKVLNRPMPCSYCYSSVCPHGEPACLAGVSPGQVLQAARDLLAMRAGKQ